MNRIDPDLDNQPVQIIYNKLPSIAETTGGVKKRKTKKTQEIRATEESDDDQSRSRSMACSDKNDATLKESSPGSNSLQNQGDERHFVNASTNTYDLNDTTAAANRTPKLIGLKSPEPNTPSHDRGSILMHLPPHIQSPLSDDDESDEEKKRKLDDLLIKPNRDTLT